MSYAFLALKKKINKIIDGELECSAEELETEAYEKYTSDKLSAEEYNEICTMVEMALC